MLHWLRLVRLPNLATAAADAVAGYLVVSGLKAVEWPPAACVLAARSALTFSICSLAIVRSFLRRATFFLHSASSSFSAALAAEGAGTGSEKGVTSGVALTLKPGVPTAGARGGALGVL